MKRAGRFVVLLLASLVELGLGRSEAGAAGDRRASLILEDEYWLALQRRTSGSWKRAEFAEFAEIAHRLSERPECFSWLETDTIRQVFARSAGAGFALAELHAEIHEFEAESGRLVLPGRRLAAWRTAIDSGDVEEGPGAEGLVSSEHGQLLVDALIALATAAAPVRVTPVLIESRNLLDRALLVGGEDADVLGGLAHLSELLGERRRATAYFERLSRLRPGDRWATYGAQRGSIRDHSPRDRASGTDAETGWIEALELQDRALEAYRRGDGEEAVRLASVGAREFPGDSTFGAICALASLVLRTRGESFPVFDAADGVRPGARLRFDLEAARRLGRRRESFRSRTESHMEDLASVIDRMRSQPDEVRPVAPICEGLRISDPSGENRSR